MAMLLCLNPTHRMVYIIGDILEMELDDEWAVPVLDDRLLFEMLILESAQSGLSRAKNL